VGQRSKTWLNSPRSRCEHALPIRYSRVGAAVAARGSIESAQAFLTIGIVASLVRVRLERVRLASPSVVGQFELDR
jgi:hypothetical protein